jgi:phage terminase Nu1 subunit (DNA packaging protein)
LLNSIIAAPSFGAWIKGESLDIANLLYTPTGKPRHSIFYIAHLSEAERMFFITLLLEQIVTWVRQQPGTTSLRALLYFDEVFGFFPPVAEPPSKRPLLTLLKQARAFGFGVVLTTQNPVDLDYKGLTNAGTWFIGRLQTERDKMRVLDGLESATSEAGGALDRRELDRIISAVSSRVFLLHNVHEDQPVIFQTRWAMSYLRGPLTRSQVRQLMADVQPDVEAPAAVAAIPARPTVRRDIAPVAAAAPETPPGYSSTPPALPPDVPQVFLPARLSPNSALARLEEELDQRLEAEETALLYEPCLLALGRVGFVDRKRGVNETKEVGLLVQPGDVGAVIRWEDADPIELDPNDLEDQPDSDALFGPIPSELNSAREIKAFGNDFSDYLYREKALNLYYNPVLKLYGQPGESERDFNVRAQQIARENRDAEVEKLRRKYEQKLDRLETRLAREERELTEDQAEYDARKREELLSAGESVIGMLGILGRRRSSAFSQAARKRRLTASAKADIEESEEEIARLQKEIEDMRRDMEEEATAITEKWAATLDEIETYAVKPRRSDVQVEVVALAWAPHWEIGYRSARGGMTHDRMLAWG